MQNDDTTACSTVLDKMFASNPPTPAASAVIPLQSYLGKYVTQFADDLIPATQARTTGRC